MSASEPALCEPPEKHEPHVPLPCGQDVWALAALLLLWGLAVAWVGLGGDYPLNDDWAYAISAKQLLHSGRMHILDWAAPSLVAHVAWGALCMRLLGESFVSLRCGTLLLSLGGAFATYGLGRCLGLLPRRAVLPALALLFSPWYVNLSFTFMSDVPWLFVVLVALCCFSVALRTQRRWVGCTLLALSGTALGVAALIRQFGVVLLPGLWVTLAVQHLRLGAGHVPSPASSTPSTRSRSADARPAWDLALRALALSLPTLLIYGVFHVWYSRVHGATLANRETWTRILQLRGYQQAFHLLAFAYYFALWLLPLLFGVLLGYRGRWSQLGRILPLRRAPATLACLGGGALLVVLIALLVGGRGLSLQRSPDSTMFPLMPYLGNIVYSLGIGPQTLNPEAYQGGTHGLPWAPWLGPLLTALCLASAGLFSGLFLDELVAALRTLAGLLPSRWAGARAAADTRDAAAMDTAAMEPSPESRVLPFAVAACYLGWHLLTGPFLFDRYLLPVLPLLWIVVVAALPSTLLQRSGRFIGLGLALMAAVSLTGTRHYLRWNQARAQAVTDLLHAGVAKDQIDAGFEYSGTWHFEEMSRRTGKLDEGRHHWWVSEIRYALSFVPQVGDCQTVARYPYYTLWPGRWPWDRGPARDAIYVLHCPPGFEWPTVKTLKDEAEYWRRSDEEKQRRCKAEGRRFCW